MSARHHAVVCSLVLVLSAVAGTALIPGQVAAADVTVVDGSADPAEVSPGDTVDNQQVTVVVDNVSADGNTDTFYLEFPNELANGLSPNYADANDTSVTESIQLVDGYDGDGKDDTLKFSTGASGGGSIPLELTIDTGVSYPDTEAVYDLGFRASDSSNGQATRAGVVSIRAGSAPTVSNYTVTNPDAREVDVSFESSEQLSDITVELTDGSGSTVTTLTESAFSETNTSDGWLYEATHTAAQDGKYTATLTEARDGGGNDGSSGESATVRVNTVSAAIEDGASDPATVSPGTTVDNQQVTVTLSGVSADGDTDLHHVEFPNELADGLQVNSATVNGSASIAQSAELVDGFDGDGVRDTVRFQTDADDGGTIPLELTVDIGVDYPDVDATYDVDARLEDSDGDTDQQASVTTIEASGSTDGGSTDGGSTDGGSTDGGSTDDGSTDGGSTDGGSTDGGSTDGGSTDDGSTDGGSTDDGSGASEPSSPTVSEFSLTATDRTVTATVAVDSPVDTLRANVSGASDEVLNGSEFVPAEANGTYRYTATVASDLPGTYSAVLETAANESGDGADGRQAFASVPLREGSGPTGAATPPWTGNGSSAHTFTTPVRTGSDLVGSELSAVMVDYGILFGASDGSVTSVSDDGDVAVLRVIRADGSTKAELGGTDAVDVNVVGDEVRLDLSDIDSERRPTLAAGDRVVIRIRPVTNPGLARDYDADIGLEGADGTERTATTSVTVRDRSETDALDTDFTMLRNESAAAALERSDLVDRVRVDSAARTIGPVRVVVPDDAPPAAGEAPGRVLTVMNVSRPPLAAGEPVELTATVDEDRLDVDAGSLVLVRYDEDADGWLRLGAETQSGEDGALLLRATSAETSTFALATTAPEDDTAQDQSTPTTAPEDDTAQNRSTPTATPEDDTAQDQSATTATPTPTDTTEPAVSGGSPRLGILGVVAALVLVVGGVLLRLRPWA